MRSLIVIGCLAALVVASAACSGTRARSPAEKQADATERELDRIYAQALAENDAWVNSNFVTSACRDASKTDASPGPCGLIFDVLSTQDAIVAFKEGRCGIPEESPTPDACVQAYHDYYVKSFAERYWAADFSSVRATCQARACETDREWEVELRRSHNGAVQRQSREWLREIRGMYWSAKSSLSWQRAMARREREAAEAQDRQRVLQGISAALDAAGKGASGETAAVLRRD